MKELRAEEVTGGVKGWLQRAYTELIQPDLFEDVPSSDTLMRIHSTAEEFDASAEELWAPFQVKSLCLEAELCLPFISAFHFCLSCQPLVFVSAPEA